LPAEQIPWHWWFTGSLVVQEMNDSDCEVILTGDEAVDCVRPKSRELTPRQADFVAAYITNGRNARQAAIAAGTSPASAGPMGYRNIRNPVILEAIRAAAGDSIKERLPELIDAMVQLALDPKTSAVARVSAFRELADRGGMAVNRGPMVQINNGVTDPKAQAQAIIAEIWAERNTREARQERTFAHVGQLIDAKRSAIAGGMSDIIDNDAPTSDGQRIAPGRGGERLQGPIPAASVIPPHPTTTYPTPDNLGLEEWRESVRQVCEGKFPDAGAGDDGDEV